MSGWHSVGHDGSTIEGATGFCSSSASWASLRMHFQAQISPVPPTRGLPLKGTVFAQNR